MVSHDSHMWILLSPAVWTKTFSALPLLCCRCCVGGRGINVKHSAERCSTRQSFWGRFCLLLFHDRTELQRSALRNVLMYGFHFAVTTIAGVRGIGDTQCGFKLFSRRAADRLFGHLH